jgi:ATP-binding cassette subfamily B (MDR/TAP) protein 1
MSATDSVDEKAPVPVKKRAFFSRKQKVEQDAASETTDVEQPAPVPATPPISFLQLFRFSTTFELMLDAIGLVAAAAAGAAQVRILFNSRPKIV